MTDWIAIIYGGLSCLGIWFLGCLLIVTFFYGAFRNDRRNNGE
jgi:hypothetical protein